MLDSFLIIFITRGVIAASGDAMALDHCMHQAHFMPSEHAHIVCINVQDPSCRVYFEDSPETKEITARCLKRVYQTNHGEKL